MTKRENNERTGLSRREAIRCGLLGAGSLMLGPLGAVGAARGAEPAPVARSLIQIWMWGGPSHLDTFDPKPEAGEDYCGPLGEAIDTNVAGIRLNATLPMLAGQADKLAIIRGMTHGQDGHETAAYLMQSGRMPSRLVYPSVGAVVSKFRGYDAGYTGIVPPYIVLTRSQGRFSEAGLLGQRYKPFCTGGDPNASRFVVEGIVSKAVTDQHQRERRELLHAIDTLGRAMPGEEQFRRLDATEEAAYEMMFGEMRRLFDLAEEPDALRERYGRTTFGQSCLMARRLVEAGVPHVTINYGGWDTHKQHFQTMTRRLPELDRGLATLLADLDERGLLDRTVVWWGGEFGRTPRVQWEPPWNGGRGHFGQAFTCVLAGGGFRGGTVVGRTDAHGERVVERPVYPPDLIGSIYQRMGIDPDGPLPNPRALDLTLLPGPEEDAPRAGRLTEIMPA